jgi:hypothetical protein
MTAVGFQMADGAVLEPRRAQVMKCRRYAPEHLPSIRGGHCTDVGVTFQTDEPHLMPREHPWIRRTVHLVTGAAALQPHRCMLESERSPLVRVAS